MTIDCSTFESLLPDALGGELSGPDRLAFESHRGRCQSCHAEYESLSQTVDRVRDRLAPDVLAAPRTIATPPRRFSLRSLSYAAVIVLAFLAGYGIRGSARAPLPVHRENSGDAATTMEQKFVMAHRQAPKSSEFTKSVLAVLGSSTHSAP